MNTKDDKHLDKILFFLFYTKIFLVLLYTVNFIIDLYDFNHLWYIDILEEVLHNIFFLAMGIMLIYLFNHLRTPTICVSGHSKFYLYSLGILMCFGVLKKIFYKYYLHKNLDDDL